MDVDIREVAVGVDRKVSDGNYGSEGVSVHLTAGVRPGQDAEEVVCELAGRAKEIVLARLAGSDSQYVRQGVTPRRAPVTGDWLIKQAPPKPHVDEEDDPDAGGL